MARIIVEHTGQPEGCLLGLTYPSGYPSSHPLKLYYIRRRVRPWGHFGTASINGTVQVLDASLPHRVARVPRDAVPEIMESYWHDDNESHVFGGPNVAATLRPTIAAHNAGGSPA